MIEGDEDDEEGEDYDEGEEEIQENVQEKPKSNLKIKSTGIEEEDPKPSQNRDPKQKKKVTFLGIGPEGIEDELDGESIESEDDEEDNPHGFVSADMIVSFRKKKK